MTKQMELIYAATRASEAARALLISPVAHSRLLKKHIFPDRKMPHRKKRLLKKQARIHQALRTAQLCVHMALAAADFHRIMTTPEYPTPYAEGGYVAPRP